MREHGIAAVQLRPESFERTKTLAMSAEMIPPVGSISLKISGREYVIVPAYPHVQQQALDLCRSNDPGERRRGVFLLRSYSSDEGVEMLKSLLNDRWADRWTMSSDTSCATYLVRAAA